MLNYHTITLIKILIKLWISIRYMFKIMITDPIHYNFSKILKMWKMFYFIKLVNLTLIFDLENDLQYQCISDFWKTYHFQLEYMFCLMQYWNQEFIHDGVRNWPLMQLTKKKESRSSCVWFHYLIWSQELFKIADFTNVFIWM